MKFVLIIAGMLLTICNVFAQKHTLEKIWETDTVIAIPESVLPHNGLMYVSLIDGSPWGADGKGGIGIIDPDGKNFNGSWVMGLNAPKGMAIHDHKLYVADLSDVLVFDIRNGKQVNKISIPGASGLNDVTASGHGKVYVSDSRTGKVWVINNDVPQMFMDSLNGVNGLKAVGNDLIIAAGKSFISVNQQDKKVKKIADLPNGGDGIEPIGNGDYLVSSWSGYIFYVSADGKVDTLLDTSKEKKNTADIGYDVEKKIIYVPSFNAKTIVAYQLK